MAWDSCSDTSVLAGAMVAVCIAILVVAEVVGAVLVQPVLALVAALV